MANRVCAYWYFTSNFGDALNWWLIRKISGKSPIFTDISRKDIPKVVVAGSILNSCDETCTVWGAGLGHKAECVNPDVIIKAVRGPLSHRKAVENAATCPKVFGDPALLLPRLYTPKPVNRATLGLIPHYVNQYEVYNSPLAHLRGVKVIDVLSPIEDFVDEVCSCDVIISSSLHGLVVADAYGKRSLRFVGVFPLGGDGIKFADYYASIKSNPKPYVVFNDICAKSVYEVVDLTSEHAIDLDLDLLWNACPFLP